MTDDKFSEYLFEYDHDGATWCITLQAPNEADARERMSRMSLARFVGGPVVANIKIPGGSLWERLFFRSKRSPDDVQE